MTKLDSTLKSRDSTLPTKVRIVNAMVFPVVTYGCESWKKEGWALKNWCFPTVVLEETLESPLDGKEIKPVHPEGNQPWIVIGRTNTEAEAPILGPPDAKDWLMGKDSEAEKDWRQEVRGTIEDEMAGWHHRLNGHEFEQTPGDGEGQGSLAWCRPWGREETEQLWQPQSKNLIPLHVATRTGQWNHVPRIGTTNPWPSNWDHRPGLGTQWSSGSWCLIAERIQWETKW